MIDRPLGFLLAPSPETPVEDIQLFQSYLIQLSTTMQKFSIQEKVCVVEELSSDFSCSIYIQNNVLSFALFDKASERLIHECMSKDFPCSIDIFSKIIPSFEQKIIRILNGLESSDTEMKGRWQSWFYDKELTELSGTSAKTLHYIAQKQFNNEEITVHIATHENVHPKTLHALAHSPYQSVRIEVAKNLHTEYATLNLLLNNLDTASYAAANPNFTHRTSYSIN